MQDIVGTHFLFEVLHRDPFWAATEASGQRRCRPVVPDTVAQGALVPSLNRTSITDMCKSFSSPKQSCVAQHPHWGFGFWFSCKWQHDIKSNSSSSSSNRYFWKIAFITTASSLTGPELRLGQAGWQKHAVSARADRGICFLAHANPAAAAIPASQYSRQSAQGHRSVYYRGKRIL